MRRFESKILPLALMSAVMLASGCKKNPPAPVQNADGSVTNPNGSVTVPAQGAVSPTGQSPAQPMAIRNPDGSITNPDGSVTYPAGSKVAQRENSPAPPATVPATGAGTVPSAPPPPPARPSIPAGTTVGIRVNQTLAASRNEVGDRWTGELSRPIVVHGETVFAAGTPVAGEVVSSKGKGRFKGAGDLGISMTAIGHESVETNVYEVSAKGRGKRTAGFVGGGAGLGALIGGLAGGGKGALIGGLAGAGGGTAASAYTGNRDVVIRAETPITFRLTRSVTR